MENWDQFEAVKEEDFTVWDRFAPVEEENDLAKELPSIQAQEQKPIQDRLVSENTREKDAIAADAAHQQQIATDLNAVAKRANKSFTAHLDRDLADYNKKSEAIAAPGEAPTQKPENLGEWLEQFTGSFARQVESELEDTRQQRAKGIWKGREDRSDFGSAFQRGALGAIESLGSGLRGYGETMERQGLRGKMFKELGGALQKGGAYGRTAAPEAKVGSLEEIGWDRKKLGDYIVAKLGEGLGSSSVFFTAGGLGGVPAAGAAAITMGSGEVRSELERNGITDPKLLDQYSYIGGTAVGLLDSVLPGKLLQALTKKAKKETGKYVVTRIARGIMKGAATEGITEAMQEAIEIASAAEAGGDQAALDYIQQLNKKHDHDSIIPNANERATRGVLAYEALVKDWKRVVEAGAAGAIPGAAMGGGRAIISEARSQKTPPETEQPVKQGIAEALTEEPTSQEPAPAATVPDVIALPDETGVIVRPDSSGQATLPEISAQQAPSSEPVATQEAAQPTSAEGAKLPGVGISTEAAPTEETATTLAETQVKPVSQSNEADRQALKQQFDELQKTISELDAMPEVPTDLADNYLDQAETMVEAFQEQGLPGMTPEEAQNIGTIDEVLQAFDTATPEEISAFWRGTQIESVVPAAKQTEVAAETVPVASQPVEQRGTPLKPESMGAMSSRQRQRMMERREALDRFASEVEVTPVQEGDRQIEPAKAETAPKGKEAAQPKLSDQQINLRKLIRTAYLKATKGNYNTRALLKDVRAELKNIPRAEFDKELKQMQVEKRAALYALDNRREITEADKKAAISFGGDPRHILWMERDPISSQEAAQPRTQPQSTNEAFYDYLESKAPLKTEVIAKKLGVDTKTVGKLAAEAEKAGWLTKTKEGKYRRVHISKRPSRGKTAQTKGVPLRPESMAARSRVRGMQLPSSMSILPGEGSVNIKDNVRLDELQSTVNAAAKKILPDAVKVKVIDYINVIKSSESLADKMLALRGFYSPAIRAAEKISMKKGTGEQFWKQITKTPGVRRDELEWMGLEEFLKDKKSVTKDEVLEFMDAHKIELDEKILGDGGLNKTTAKVNEISLDDANKIGMNLDPVIDNEFLDKIWSYSYQEGSYFIIMKMKGKEEYTIHDPEKGRYARSSTFGGAEHIAQGWRHNDTGQSDNVRFENFKVPGGENYRELLIRFPDIEGQYKSLHFQDQEIVHVRIDDRNGKNGEKILFINEIQSDLHQQGRRYGYIVEDKSQLIAKLKSVLEGVKSEIVAIRRERSAYPEKYDDTSVTQKLVDLRSTRDKIETQLYDLTEANRQSPSAPFKGDLWLELALKRILRYAVDNGYDAVSWARSDQIAKAVGQDPEKLALQYDQKIPRFLEKYTKKWDVDVFENYSIDKEIIANSSKEILDRLSDNDLNNMKAIAIKQGITGELYNLRPRLIAQLMDRAGINTDIAYGRNKLLRITPQMRASVMEGQPYAISRSTLETLGNTDPENMIISIAMRAVEAEAAAKGTTAEAEGIRVIRHEAIEFFKAIGMFRENEWNMLTETARKQGWIESTGVRKAYEQLYKEGMSEAELNELLLKEAIAEQYSEFHTNRKEFSGPIAKAFQRIKDFITRVSNLVRGMGFQKWEDVFEKIDEGEFKRRFEQEFPEINQPGKTTLKGMQLPGAEAIAPDSIAPAARSGVTLPEMSMTEIKRNIIDTLGLRVRRGRLNEAMKREAKKRGQTLQGQYDEETDIVRVREMNDVETIFHEAGHSQINLRFKERFGTALNQAMVSNETELQALDPSGQSSTEEGFADFFRRYLTNYKMAEARAPNFYRQFEDIVGGINPDLLANMQEVQKRVEEYQTSTSAGRLMSSTKSTVKLGRIETTKQDIKKYGRYAPMKWMRDVRGWLQKVYHSRVSDVNWIHLWNIEVAKNAERNNKHLDFSFWKNPSKQAQQLNNAYTAGFSDLSEGVHFYGVNRKGSVSYYDALEHAFGGQERAQWTEQVMNAFGTYLLARRGRWLWQRFQPDPNAQIKGEFQSPPQGQFTNGQWYVDKSSNAARIWINGKWENELTHAPDKNSRADHEEAISSLEKEYPQFEHAANLMYKFLQDWTLKEYQAGLLTDEAFDMRLKTTDYVPWFRIMDADQAFIGGKTKRKVQQQRALHGSYRDFINPLESIAKMVYEGNYNIRVNNMKRTMQEVAMTSGVGYGHLAEPIDPTQARGTKVNLFDALKNEAKKRGVTDEDADALITSVIGSIGDNGNTTVFKRGEINERGERVIYYLRKGKLNAFVLADDNIGKGVFHFFQTLGDAPDLDGLVNLIAAPGRLMQTAVTSHPRFQVWNMIRDQFMAPAMVPGYVPFVSNVKTALDNWYLRRQESGVAWNEIVASHAGIMGGMNTTAHMQLRQNRDIKALRQKGVTWNPVKADFWLGTVSPFSKQFWRWTEASEASTRQTIARIEYKHALKEMKELYPGMPQEELEFLALEDAVFKSANYVPYNRGGAKMSFLRQVVRFLNAGIQGTDRSFKVALAAEMESGQWAMPRAIKKGTKTVAALVMPWLKHSRGEPLTAMEKKALSRAFYYWSIVASIAVVQNILRAMGDDDDEALKEELTDYHDTTYIHVSLPYTDDVVAFFPRGFDLVGTLSNAISAGYDEQWRQDPTAKERFLESSYRMLLPAHSVAGLDVYSGLFENYDRFTERPIIPDYMKRGLLPEDQHHGWTDPISLEVGKQLGVSPNQVSFAMSKLGSQYANDLKTIAIAANPNREELHWWEYPVISSFFRDPAKFSRSKQKYYDTILEYHQNLGSYKQRIKERDQTEIKRFLEAATPDIRAYLVAQNHVDAKQRRLHPLVRAQEIYSVTNGIVRDIVMDRLPQAGPRKKKEAYLTLSPTQKRDAFDILRGIEMRELRRTLILMKVPGWEQKRDDLLKPDKYYNELKKVLPQVWAVYQQRTHGGRRGNEPRVYDFATVKRLWPDVRKKLLDNNVLSDIVNTRGEVKENILLPEMVEAQGASL